VPATWSAMVPTCDYHLELGEHFFSLSRDRPLS
jgi:hypothetical protein